jgi:probable rRNA maturation factor
MSAMPRSRLVKQKPKSHVRPLHRVEIANRFRGRKIDVRRLRKAVLAVLSGEKIEQADISLAVVNDRTIAELNERFLDHQGPTDVISFALEDQTAARAGTIDGEIVVSAETAIRAAGRFGTSMQYELLLYAIHGTLHLTGYDDLTAAKCKIMRRKESLYMTQIGVLFDDGSIEDNRAARRNAASIDEAPT